jgi:hypothetical protein
VLEVVSARALQRAGDELAVRIAGVEPAGLGEELLAALAFELAPQRPRAAEERDVVGVLVIGEANDPRESARRSESVSPREAIEAEDRRATRGEPVCGRAAVSSEPRDDDIDASRRIDGYALSVSRIYPLM